MPLAREVESGCPFFLALRSSQSGAGLGSGVVAHSALLSISIDQTPCVLGSQGHRSEAEVRAQSPDRKLQPSLRGIRLIGTNEE